MADKIKFLTGLEDNLSKVPLKQGQIYFALVGEKGKIAYDAPFSSGTKRIFMSAEFADRATLADSATKATSDGLGHNIADTYIDDIYTKTTDPTGLYIKTGAGTEYGPLRLAFLPLAGGTVTGATTFSGGLTANKVTTTDLTVTGKTSFTNPITGSFIGDLTGNADSATKATSDGLGANIASTYVKSFSVLGRTVTFTRGDGTTGTFTTQDSNTKNTAGSTDSSKKLFLIGAESQAANPQTYSHDTVYVGTDGCLYSNSTKVSVEGHSHSWANITNKPAAILASAALNTAKTGITFTKVDGGTYTLSPSFLPLAGGSLTGDLALNQNNEDRFITFYYTGNTGFDWRIGSLGTGSGDANYFVIQSDKNDGTYVNAMQIGLTSLDVTFSGNVTAPKFIGALNGTADKAISDSYNNVIGETYIKSFSVSGKTVTFTRGDGTTGTFTTQDNDTKNTAGSTNSSSKLFLIGATSQGANPQTYSHDTAYVGTDGHLYSNSTKVSVEGHSHSWSSITSKPSKIAAEVYADSTDTTKIINKDVSGTTTTIGYYAPLTNGLIDLKYLPQGALERLVKVTDQAARYKLTTSNVQLGDTVLQLDTGLMYIVVDESKLSSANGYQVYTAGSASAVPWTGITGKPSVFLASAALNTAKTGIVFTKIDGGTYTLSPSFLPLAGGTLSGALNFSSVSPITWNNGTYQQRINIVDDSTTDTSVFQFQQSSDTGASWTTLFTIKDNGKVVASEFHGALKGTADKATGDSNGANIAATYIKGLSVSGRTITYTRGDGTTGTITTQDNNTKNTAGSTDSSKKLFIIGAESQAANPQTYSHNTVWIDTDGCLYSNSTKVSVEGHTHSWATLTNKPTALVASAALNSAKTGITFTKEDGGTYTLTPSFLPLAGGTMTGNITFSGDNIITWSRNSDSATVGFKNTSDDDTDSYMYFKTGDNGNEHFKFQIVSGSTTNTVLTLKNAAATFNGTVTATTFVGNLTGTATNATSDAGGQNIQNTYMKYPLTIDSATHTVITMKSGANASSTITTWNHYPTTWTWANGTSSGPTATIKMVRNGVDADATDISVAAIPTATDARSGIVTTGTQTFAGLKKFVNTTASTSKTTGAVQISGGLGVAGQASANMVMIADAVTLKYDSTNKCLNFVFA